MKRKVGLLKGDGIGPEIIQSVVDIFSHMKLDIDWVEVVCGEESLKTNNSPMPESSIQMVKELGVALKGPTATPIAKGHKSANVTLRKKLDLFANVRPCFRLAGIETPFPDVDLIILRENTEDLYTAIEYQASPEVAECLKVITRPGCERISRMAFELARKLGRKKVTCVHKANIMKLTDGLFLNVFREVAKGFQDIESNDVIIDNACMQLVRKPSQFDVLVTENLYGDILSDLCAGLIGGLGLAGGANLGEKAAVFEAVHGTAPDIAGQNKANPTAMILSAIMMLQHLGMREAASSISQALDRVFSEKKHLTRDLGGNSSTSEFTKAVITEL